MLVQIKVKGNKVIKEFNIKVDQIPNHVSKMMKCKRNQITITHCKQCLFDVNRIMNRTSNKHSGILQLYQKHGRNYFKKPKYKITLHKLYNFFDIYEDIKTNGFNDTQHLPIIIYKDPLEENNIRRRGGSHRVAIAKLLGIKKIPVIIVNYEINGKPFVID